MRTITIQFGEGAGSDDGLCSSDGYCVVDEYGRTSGLLCWDEMLGQVASITHPSINKVRYGMAPPEERRRRREEAHARMAATRAAELVDNDTPF